MTVDPTAGDLLGWLDRRPAGLSPNLTAARAALNRLSPGTPIAAGDVDETVATIDADWTDVTRTQSGIAIRSLLKHWAQHNSVDGIEMVARSMPLRAGIDITVLLPVDLTEGEARRLAQWISTMAPAPAAGPQPSSLRLQR